MKVSRALLAATLLAGFSAAAHAQQITGAGSTFAAPIYGKWAEASQAKTGVTLNYQAIGSGAGQNQVFNRTVDFGATDAPLKGADLAAHKLLQFPTVMGAVDIIVNVPGIKADQLKLTGPVLAQIYLGNITSWSDAAIAKLNPGVKLPNLPIAPVYRADASGTTFVFTSYLSKISSDWKDKVGAAKSVRWLNGAGARGSDGVSGTVRNVRGGVGYVESSYATQNHLITVEMQNHDGKFVRPTLANFGAAAANADWSKADNFAIDLNDQPGANSWPIVTATFVLLPTDPTDAARSAAVVKYFGWAFDEGDDVARKLEYVPLPKAVKDSVHAAWKATFKTAGQ
ncbi:MAG TPA: phosphate ABC transporter substrate-binding protein PstS [Acetobacteraceae bacterium]|nr:phosphate ABC transporter substrate-binding protein PstS [Acetobacteraceae bacterium]